MLMLMFPSVLIMEPVFSDLDVMMKSLLHCDTFVHDKIREMVREYLAIPYL